MNKLIRLYNQNRKFFMIVIVSIIACLIGIYMLNQFYKNQQYYNNPLYNNGNYTLGDIQSIEENRHEISNGENQDLIQYAGRKSLIEQFVGFCNNKEYENAYNLVSDECKQKDFPNVQAFKEKYVDEIFNENKTCNIQAWSNETYLVKITEDLLATGKTSDESYIEEYITIASGNRLNINSYIGSRELNLKNNKANVDISLKKIYYYIDYATIDINVKNQRKTPILLDSYDESGNIYLEDDLDLQYKCDNYGEDNLDFVVEADLDKDFTLKFKLPYSKISAIKSICFNKILADYNQYKQIGDSRLIQLKIDI